MAFRTLLLLRHAKSSRDDATLDDFDRPLAPRGRKAAPVMAHEIARRGWQPDAVLVSAAKRTRQTWDLVAPKLGRTMPAVFERAIYEAPGARILDAIRTTADDVETLLVVGHNPGLEDLSVQLASNESNADALGRLKDKFPTAALARFTFDGDWRGLNVARLEAFIRPGDVT